MSHIAENLQNIKNELGTAKLIAVSKTRTVEEIREAYNAGQREFGENKVQELADKAEQLADLDIHWHFIGHLQSNKIPILRKIPHLVSIHSIDSINLLNKILSKTWVNKIGVFLQINTSGEAEKSGFSDPDEIEVAVRLLQDASEVNLQGLMTIGAIRTDEFEKEAERCFSMLAEVKKALDVRFDLNLELSMGMSSDYPIAVKLGSDWVRVGTAIFGARNL